jgi:hypothetical protein
MGRLDSWLAGWVDLYSFPRWYFTPTALRFLTAVRNDRVRVVAYF